MRETRLEFFSQSFFPKATQLLSKGQFIGRNWSREVAPRTVPTMVSFLSLLPLLFLSFQPFPASAFSVSRRHHVSSNPLIKPQNAVGRSDFARTKWRERIRPNMATESEDSAVASGFFDPSKRMLVRSLGIGLVWAGLTAYVLLGAPGKDEASQALDNELLMKIIANPFDESVPPLFVCLFNYMGIWPAIYAALLLPGAANQKPVPAAPFVAGSVAFGMFALSPYLALREYRGGDAEVTQKELNGITRWFESRLNAILLTIGAVSLGTFGITANGGDLSTSIQEFQELFATQLFPHITTLDFLALWGFSFGVMAEDMDRRGMDDQKAPLFCLFPVFGHMLYLLLRKPLPES